MSLGSEDAHFLLRSDSLPESESESLKVRLSEGVRALKEAIKRRGIAAQ
jgi:hypothetical protein